MVIGRKTPVDTRPLLASNDQMETAFNGKTADNEAFQHVRDNMEELNCRAGAQETDLLFLRHLLDNCVLRSLVQVLAAIRFFGSGSYQMSVGQDNTLGISQQSVSNCIHQVLDAVEPLMENHVKFQVQEDLIDEVKLGFLILTEEFCRSGQNTLGDLTIPSFGKEVASGHICIKDMLREWRIPGLLVQDQLEVPHKLAPDPVGTGSTLLANEVKKTCQSAHSSEAKELGRIFHKPHFKALLESHDTIAEKSYNGTKKTTKHQNQSYKEETKRLENKRNGQTQSVMNTQPIRIVGLRKIPNEPLGFTVQVDENGNLVVARVLAGGVIERQGLLYPGDVILEVNSVNVTSPDELQFEVNRAKENVTLRIAPNTDNVPALKTHQCYMRALFDYEPKDDSLLPCREIGLAFKHGDILQIVNQKDPNWWQAKLVGQDGPAGLIPSQELEERRKAFVKPEADYVHKISICGTRISKKKRKQMYESKLNSEFDKAELLLYEEVTRMPPFKRRTLALIGTHGVGRRTLKNRLINSDSNKFGAVIPMTSRPQRELEDNGANYWFNDRESMEKGIREHQFLEYGEHNGHLYGTTLESIRDVIHQGKMCILDCGPAALKILHNSSEFMPYVIFIAAPGMELLKQMYNFNRSTGTSSRNLTFDRQSSIRYSSRRARTLESLASLYEEDDLRRTVEDSCSLQRAYEKYIDLVIVNEDFDQTFRRVIEALESLSTEHQWVPVNWVY